MLRSERPSSSNARRTPTALSTPPGSSISAARLNTSCRSSPASRTTRRASAEWPSQVPITTAPALNGTPAARRLPSRLAGGLAPIWRVSLRSGNQTIAPFSATTASNTEKSTRATRRSSSTRPVTSKVTMPRARAARRAAATSGAR